MKDRIAALKVRIGWCACGGWACNLDNVLHCKVKAVCDAHDRGITQDAG